MSETDFSELKSSIQDLKTIHEGIQQGIEDNRIATTVVAKDVLLLTHQVNGNPNVRLPSGSIDRGLAGKVWDYGETVEVVKDMIKVLKIVGAFFLAATGTGLTLIIDRFL